MSAIDQVRKHGWLPHPGPEHTRAVISVFFFLALFLSVALPIARLQIEGTGRDWRFSYTSNFGPGTSSSSVSSSSNDRVATELELLEARIEDVEDIDDTGVYQLALFAGLFASARSRHGSVIGMVAAGSALSSVWGFSRSIGFQFRNAQWPLPVSADLDLTWGLWLSIGLAAGALLWNILRFRLDRRDQSKSAQAAN